MPAVFFARGDIILPASAHNNRKTRMERMMEMDRQAMPVAAPEPDIADRPREIRVPARSENHEARGALEAQA